MRNTVLQRTMFRPQIVRRQTGTPQGGEMNPNIKFDGMTFSPAQAEELDQYTLLVNDPSFQSFLMDSYGEQGQGILDILLQGNTPENFSYLTDLLNQFTNYKISNEMKEKGALEPKPFEIPEQELNYLNRLKYKAEGSPMEGETVDAVGIADGLDSEEEVSMTAESGSSDDGIAKVSPEQYVQLMNEIRGDDVPLEGRVQELAMTVGEQDAQATPLSVLTLVQPVFELQEQQGGIGATDQAAQMVPQQPVPMRSGGIVYRQDGSDFFGELKNTIDPSQASLIESMAKNLFGYGKEVDVEGLKRQYASQLGGDKLKNQALLSASPYLLAFGASALDPEITNPELIKMGAGALGQFGQEFGKQKSNIDAAALNLALADKKAQQDKEAALTAAIAPKILDMSLKSPMQIAKEQAELTTNLLSNKKLMAEANIWDEKLNADLNTILLNNSKAIKELGVLDQSLANKLQLEDLQIQNNLLDNSLKNIELAYADENALEKLAQIKNANLLSQKQIDVFDEESMLKMAEAKAKIAKLEYELNNPKEDWEKIKIEQTYRDKWANNPVVDLTNERYKFFTDLNSAIIGNKFDPLKELVITDDEGNIVKKVSLDGIDDQGAKDIVIMFSFMKLNDPASVVREGEQLLLKTSSGYLDQLTELVDRFKGGAFLGNEQRLNIYNQAKGIMANSIEQLYDEYKIYSDIATRSNLDPTRAMPVSAFKTFFEMQPDFFEKTGADPSVFGWTGASSTGKNNQPSGGSLTIEEGSGGLGGFNIMENYLGGGTRTTIGNQ